MPRASKRHDVVELDGLKVNLYPTFCFPRRKEILLALPAFSRTNKGLKSTEGEFILHMLGTPDCKKDLQTTRLYKIGFFLLRRAVVLNGPEEERV